MTWEDLGNFQETDQAQKDQRWSSRGWEIVFPRIGYVPNIHNTTFPVMQIDSIFQWNPSRDIAQQTSQAKCYSSCPVNWSSFFKSSECPFEFIIHSTFKFEHQTLASKWLLVCAFTWDRNSELFSVITVWYPIDIITCAFIQIRKQQPCSALTAKLCYYYIISMLSWQT